MSLRRDPLALFVLAGLCIAGLFALVLCGRAVPQLVETLTTMVVGGALGLATQPAAPAAAERLEGMPADAPAA